MKPAAPRGHWLVKSEPDSFSWDQQVENDVEPWTGVRSHQARRNLEAMRAGDRAFFYHSNVGKEIVGIVEVVREAYPDPTGPDWVAVDMRAIGPAPTRVTLAEMRADPVLADFLLVRQSRLSVVPVRPEEWAHIAGRAGLTGDLAK